MEAIASQFKKSSKFFKICYIYLLFLLYKAPEHHN